MFFGLRTNSRATRQARFNSSSHKGSGRSRLSAPYRDNGLIGTTAFTVCA